jgi:hypothetical protein
MRGCVMTLAALMITNGDRSMWLYTSNTQSVNDRTHHSHGCIHGMAGHTEECKQMLVFTNKQTNKKGGSKLNESTYRWHHSVELSFDQGKKRVGLSAATAEVVDGIRDAPVALHGGGGAAVHVCVCVCVCVCV